MNYIELFASCIGPMVDKQQNGESKVTAVYRNGFSVLLSDRKGIYVTNRDRSGPFNVYVSNMGIWLPLIKPRQKIVFKDEKIKILEPRLCVNLKLAKTWFRRDVLKIAKPDDIIINIFKTLSTSLPIARARSEAFNTLYSIMSTGEVSYQPSTSLLPNTRYLQAFSILLYSIPIRKSIMLSNAARSLLGFGHGSTPSGDDVVAGLIATLHIAGKYFGLKEEEQKRIFDNILKKRSLRTNLLSSSLLWAAANGEVDEILREIIIKMVASDDIQVQDIENLGAIGYSSGFDGLTGAIISLLSLSKLSKFEDQ